MDGILIKYDIFRIYIFFSVIGSINEKLDLENRTFKNLIKFLNFPITQILRGEGFSSNNIFLRKTICISFSFIDFLKCLATFKILRKMDGRDVNNTPVVFLNSVRYKYFFLKIKNKSVSCGNLPY